MGGSYQILAVCQSLFESFWRFKNIWGFENYQWYVDSTRISAHSRVPLLYLAISRVRPAEDHSQKITFNLLGDVNNNQPSSSLIQFPKETKTNYSNIKIAQSNYTFRDSRHEDNVLLSPTICQTNNTPPLSPGCFNRPTSDFFQTSKGSEISAF